MSITDLQPICNPSSDTQQHIVYFRYESPDTDTTAIVEKLPADTGRQITVCNSCKSLMSHLIAISETSLVAPFLLVSISVFQRTDITITEIFNVLSSLHRFLDYQIVIKLAVAVECVCSNTLLKELQCNMLGVVPLSTIFGYDSTLTALDHLLSGKTYWPINVTNMVSNRVITKPSKDNGIVLTTRQSQVLSLVCNRGLSNKKIAQVLNIAESTVKIHISAILKSYGVRNRTQLALAANSALTGKMPGVPGSAAEV